jgi:LuxR family transcriptional regulator, maltose regulon positive regulatory protein
VADPGRLALIDRRALVAALDRAVEKRVTIISAPAGSGKTSLLRAWADRPNPNRRIVFLSVRPGQRDAQLFWLALLESVGGAVSPAPGSDGQAVADRVRSVLTASADPVVLVIDDLQELVSAGATEQLTALLQDLPPHVHAVVATRHDLPLRLHQLRLLGELAEIRARQLRFSPDETRQLLDASGIRLPAAVVATLHERTEGWAAGLRLAALSLAGHPHPEQFVTDFSGSDRTVADYLMAEMLERQPPDIQRLLLATSLLDRVNGELGDLLTGGTGSEHTLLELEDANAFVTSIDPDRTWFRYHLMTRDMLRLELRRTRSPEIPQLHRRAAAWLADHAQTAEAIQHLQAAGDWTTAARLLTDHALSLTLDGQSATVAALLAGFPARAATEVPELAPAYAIAALNQARLDQADAHLDTARAYAATAPPGRQHRLRLVIASLDLLLARLRGHFDGVFEQARALIVADDRRSIAAGDRDLRAVALLNAGVTEAWSLRLSESEHYLREGAALAHELGRSYLEVACLAHLGFTAIATSFQQALQLCDQAVTLAAGHGWTDEPVIAPALATKAGILIWTGDFDGGRQWLERARYATRNGAEPGLRMLIHLTSAILPAARGEHEAALAEFSAAGRVRAQMAGAHALAPRAVGWTIATLARLGETDQAEAALAALDDRLAGTGEVRNAVAVVRLVQKDPEAARREIRTVLDGTAPVNPYFALVEAHLLDALACRDLGDDHGVTDALERALHLAEPDRLILPFAMTGAASLLAALAPAETAHAALAADILDAVGGRAPASGPVEPLSPAELRVLGYLPTNLTRPEIARHLSISINTINTHIRRIYAKLGASDRTSAVERGRQLRLLSAARR